MTSQAFLNRYRIWCETSSAYRYVWSTSLPTSCPDNGSHTISLASTTIIQSLRCYLVDDSASPYRYRKYQLVADTSSGDLEIILKDTGRVTWDFVIVKPASSGTVTLTPFAGQTIDGSPSYTLTGATAVILSANGSDWTVTADNFQNLTIPEPERWEDSTYGKGEILVDNGTSLIPLTVGANNEYLQVDLTAETGLRWQNAYTETATLSNKSHDDATTYLTNSGDNTKRVRFNLSNVSTSTTVVLTPPGTDGTLVTTSGVETLTNKSITMGGTLNMNSQTLTGLVDPVLNSDAANKNYVDTVAAGISVKDPVVVATTGAGTLASSFANGSMIDGAILTTGDRILVKDQVNPVENGIYKVNASGAPSRTVDCSTGKSVGGSFVFVLMGTTHADSGWVCTSDKSSDVVGTDGLNWGQFSGAGQIIAGDGLLKTGETLDVDLKVNGGLTIQSEQLAVDLGASDITGTASVTNGGTGRSSLMSGYFMVGNGTLSVQTTKVVPSGEVVGTTASQTLTNKTISADANTVSNLADTNVKSGAAINTNKIGLGTVSNTVFDYLKTLDKDIATKFSEHIPYSETDLVHLEHATPGSSNHTRLQLTRSHTGTDTYSTGVDANPVKFSWTSEGGVNRQAVEYSNADSSAGVVFGVATSGNNGSTWTSRLAVTQGGNVGVGTSSPGYRLDVSGTAKVLDDLRVGGDIIVTGTVDGRDVAMDGTSLDDHLAASSGVHGLAGSVVGTSDTQTLTNKTMGDNLDLDNYRIINLALPSNTNDAASKLYVDSVASGLSIKSSVVAASTGSNINLLTLTNGESLDDITLATGDRVLVKDQTSALENGLYVIAVSGAPSRASDYLAGTNAASTFVFVQQGTVNADSGWVCTSDTGSDVVGTDALTFSQFSGAGQINAGNGLSKSGNTLDVDLKSDGGLVIESSKLAIDLSASQITGTLAVSDGGTGATTFTSGYFLQGNGTSAVSTSRAVPSGVVVGTSDSQTLTNKTISATNNTISGLVSSDVGLGNVANTKCNFSASSDPGASDDNSGGYSIGSVWINTSNNRVYQASSAAFPKFSDL